MVFRPAAIAPNYSKPVLDMVKMDWVLGFERAKKVYDEILRDKPWTKVYVQREIAKWLDSDGYLNYFPGSQLYGDLAQSPVTLDDHYIHQRPIRYEFGSMHLDDLMAALGSFTLHVAAAGTVTTQIAETGQDITINEIGIFIVDSYDFEGEQTLGFWDEGYRDDWGHPARPVRVSTLPYAGTQVVTITTIAATVNVPIVAGISWFILMLNGSRWYPSPLTRTISGTASLTDPMLSDRGLHNLYYQTQTVYRSRKVFWAPPA